MKITCKDAADKVISYRLIEQDVPAIVSDINHMVRLTVRVGIPDPGDTPPDMSVFVLRIAPERGASVSPDLLAHIESLNSLCADCIKWRRIVALTGESPRLGPLVLEINDHLQFS